MPIKIKKKNETEEMLESDEEFPSEYCDIQHTPSYLNDSRFLKISFPWLTAHSKSISVDHTLQTKYQYQPEVVLPVLYQTVNERTLVLKTKDLKGSERICFNKGILRLQDVKCLQHIEPIATDALMLWFTNYLLYKEMQSNYSYLKSCLACELHTAYYDKSTMIDSSKNHKFDIIMKN